MSLQTIRDTVWDILLQEAASPSPADNFTVLTALNAVRLDAERNHDWVASKRVAYLRVMATTGSLLSTATEGYSAGVGPTGAQVRIKGIRRARRGSGEGNWAPAHVMTYDKYETLLVSADRKGSIGLAGDEWRPSYYDGTDPQMKTMVEEQYRSFLSTKAVLLQDGLRAYVNEDADQDFKLWVYEWLPPYLNMGTDDDFMITYGSDYLLWGAIEWLNFKKGAFLPRKEGSITPEMVTAMKDKAWASLQLWDAYMQQTDNTYIGAD